MDGYMTQAEFIRRYEETHREEFNPLFFERSNQDIMDCVKKVFLSCEKDRYFTLKVLDMEEIYDYAEIYDRLRQHWEDHRKKNNKDDNPYDFIEINDSAVMMLSVKLYVRHNGSELVKNDATGMNDMIYNPWDIITILLLLPRFVDKYYFRLKGNNYSDVFQIVDGSTYNNANANIKSKKSPCNSFKTLFTPIRIYKMYKNMQDVFSGLTVSNTVYTSMIFNNHVNCMFYIFANYGLYGAMDFLEINCIQILRHPIEDDRYYNFEKNGIYISYPKVCAQDPIVQSFAVTIYEGIKKDTNIEDLFSIEYWIINLGKCFAKETIDKGLFILDSIDGSYDIITQENLHLPMEEKRDIYTILRWLMREFYYLRKKDNIDVTLKRLRIGECIAQLVAMRLNNAIYNLSDSGKKVTLNGIKRRIYMSPMQVINSITDNKNMTNLISYRDLVNDNDALLALKYTYKGISGLGEGSAKIQEGYRYVDTSHIGIVDLDSSTVSDPGMSGTLCPLGTMATKYPMSFTDYEEPNFWREKYLPFQTDFFKEEYPNLTNPFVWEREPEKEYYNLRNKVINENLAIDTVTVALVDATTGRDDNWSMEYEALKQLKEQEKSIPTLFSVRSEDD